MKLLISLAILVVMFCSCRHAPSAPEYPWKPYSIEAIKASEAQGKPIIIDFWAEWCPNCHDLDREVFSRPEIQAQLSHLTTLRMDVTNQDDPHIQQIIQEYSIEGVPTVVFLDAHGKEIDNARVIGFVTPKDFEQSLAMVKILK